MLEDLRGMMMSEALILLSGGLCSKGGVKMWAERTLMQYRLSWKLPWEFQRERNYFWQKRFNKGTEEYVAFEKDFDFDVGEDNNFLLWKFLNVWKSYVVRHATRTRSKLWRYMLGEKESHSK